MRLSIIVAVAENGVIGRSNDLPWRLPADLKRFKRLTLDHHLLLGRKTFDAIGRPLPGRKMVVISRRRPVLPAGVQLAASLSRAIEIAEHSGDDEAFVGGGAQIYLQALPLADRIYLTRLETSFDGDAFFPELGLTEWRRVSQEHHEADDDNPWPYSFEIYEPS